MNQNITIKLRLKGETPLLQNRMEDSTLLDLWKKTPKKSKTASRPETPRESCLTKTYGDDDTGYYIPADNFWAALVEAGRYVRLDGKRQVSTRDSTLLPAIVSLKESKLHLDTAGWEVDIKQGRNPNGGEAVCIVRPRFDDWAFECTMELDPTEATIAHLRQVVEYAGKRIGLGDFRPSRKGRYGQFSIVRWDEELNDYLWQGPAPQRVVPQSKERFL